MCFKQSISAILCVLCVILHQYVMLPEILDHYFLKVEELQQLHFKKREMKTIVRPDSTTNY